MWKILSAASTALVLVGTPALAQWETYDANSDAVVDETEFRTGFGTGGVFTEWDANRDAQLDRDEWGTGMFGLFDRDRDSTWNEQEFRAYGDRNFRGYGAWDEDESGFLSEDEFSRGVYGGYTRDPVVGWTEEEYRIYEEDEWF